MVSDSAQRVMSKEGAPENRAVARSDGKEQRRVRESKYERSCLSLSTKVL
jgi:hypothetical protein